MGVFVKRTWGEGEVREQDEEKALREEVQESGSA